MLRGVDFPCEPYKTTINNNIRTAENPCGLFCNTADMRAWRERALSEIKSAIINRPDLPANYQAWLRDHRQMIESMPESVVSVGEDTRWLARVAQDAHCILNAPKNETLPDVKPIRPKENDLQSLIKKIMMVGGIGLALYFFFKLGLHKKVLKAVTGKNK